MAAAFIYVLLFLFIGLFELARRRENRIDFLSVFHLFFVVYYVIPGLIFAFQPELSSLGFGLNTVESSNHFATSGLVAVCYASVIAGFHWCMRRRGTIEIVMSSRPHSSARLVGYGLALLGVASLAIVIYVAQYGNLTTALAQSALIRSGGVEGGSFVFVKRFIPAAFLALALGVGGVLARPRSGNVWRAIAFGGVLASVLSFLLLSGRGYVIQVAIIVYWTVVIVTRRWHWRSVIVAVSVGIVVVAFGDPLFVSLRHVDEGPRAVAEVLAERVRDREEDSAFQQVYVREFQHYMVSALVAEKNSHGQDADWRWFSDLAIGILSYVPEQLVKVEIPHSIAFRNTLALHGVEESRIPPGLVAFGLYSAGWFGVIVVGLACGVFGAFLSRLFRPGAGSDPWTSVLYASWGVAWAFGILQGEPRVFLQSNFAVILVTVVTMAGRLMVRYSTGSPSEAPGTCSTD